MAARRLFWAAAWLGIALIIIKASHLGIPRAGDVVGYVRSMAAITCRDVLFAVSARPRAGRLISSAFVALASLVCLYALASMIAFGPLGGFLTYPLLQLVGSVRMMSSSILAFVTPTVVFALVAVPLAYVGLVSAARGGRTRTGIALWTMLGVWIGVGQYVYATDWKMHYDWRIAENPPWVLVSSLWQAVSGGPTARLTDAFAPSDLADFAPIGSRPAPIAPATRRPPNVILIVLESVAARWTSVSGGTYDSTLTLKAEAAHGIVFDRLYALQEGRRVPESRIRLRGSGVGWVSNRGAGFSGDIVRLIGCPEKASGWAPPAAGRNLRQLELLILRSGTTVYWTTPAFVISSISSYWRLLSASFI